MNLKTKRLLALIVTFCLCVDGSAMPAIEAAENTGAARAVLPLQVPELSIPKNLGSVLEIFKGQDQRIILLIQDAHSIPDAQRSIRKIIDYFQNQNGIDLIGVEGASSKLDPQIFRSYPDQARIKKLFEQYVDQGQLTGASLAALQNSDEADYWGVENWPLYEEGLGYFLQADQMREQIHSQLKPFRDGIERAKRENYSSKLLEIDQDLQRFQSNNAELASVLEKLAAVKAPEKESMLGIFLREIAKQNPSISIDQEVKSIADIVGHFLRSNQQGLRDELLEFNLKQQSFQTSQITAKEFGAFLKGLCLKHQISNNFSLEFERQTTQEKRMRDIQGSKFLDEFERYVDAVKKELFVSEEERKIDFQSRQIDLLKRLADLELSREGWKRVKQLFEKVRSEEISRDFVIGDNDAINLLQSMEPHIRFYQNTERRDAAMLANLLDRMKSKSALLISGGFHSEGMTEILKKKGISYALMAPAIDQVPDKTNYRELMRGSVAWAKYFQNKNGKVNLYEAFVKSICDQLLSGGGPSPKMWRDQILRDLAGKNKLSEASNYTRLIDEALTTLPREWEEKIDWFIEGLKNLKLEGRWNRENIAGLLSASTIQSAVSGAALSPRSELRAELIMNAVTPDEVGVVVESFSQDSYQAVIEEAQLKIPASKTEARAVSGEVSAVVNLKPLNPQSTNPDFEFSYDDLGQLREIKMDFKGAPTTDPAYSIRHLQLPDGGIFNLVYEKGIPRVWITKDGIKRTFLGFKLTQNFLFSGKQVTSERYITLKRYPAQGVEAYESDDHSAMMSYLRFFKNQRGLMAGVVLLDLHHDNYSPDEDDANGWYEPSGNLGDWMRAAQFENLYEGRGVWVVPEWYGLSGEAEENARAGGIITTITESLFDAVRTIRSALPLVLTIDFDFFNSINQPKHHFPDIEEVRSVITKIRLDIQNSGRNWAGVNLNRSSEKPGFGLEQNYAHPDWSNFILNELNAQFELIWGEAELASLPFSQRFSFAARSELRHPNIRREPNRTVVSWEESAPDFPVKDAISYLQKLPKISAAQAQQEMIKVQMGLRRDLVAVIPWNKNSSSLLTEDDAMRFVKGRRIRFQVGDFFYDVGPADIRIYDKSGIFKGETTEDALLMNYFFARVHSMLSSVVTLFLQEKFQAQPIDSVAREISGVISQPIQREALFSVEKIILSGPFAAQGHYLNRQTGQVENTRGAGVLVGHPQRQFYTQAKIGQTLALQILRGEQSPILSLSEADTPGPNAWYRDLGFIDYDKQKIVFEPETVFSFSIENLPDMNTEEFLKRLSRASSEDIRGVMTNQTDEAMFLIPLSDDLVLRLGIQEVQQYLEAHPIRFKLDSRDFEINGESVGYLNPGTFIRERVIEDVEIYRIIATHVLEALMEQLGSKLNGEKLDTRGLQNRSLQVVFGKRAVYIPNYATQIDIKTGKVTLRGQSVSTAFRKNSLRLAKLAWIWKNEAEKTVPNLALPSDTDFLAMIVPRSELRNQQLTDLLKQRRQRDIRSGGARGGFNRRRIAMNSMGSMWDLDALKEALVLTYGAEKVGFSAEAAAHHWIDTLEEGQTMISFLEKSQVSGRKLLWRKDAAALNAAMSFMLTVRKAAMVSTTINDVDYLSLQSIPLPGFKNIDTFLDSWELESHAPPNHVRIFLVKLAKLQHPSTSIEWMHQVEDSTHKDAIIPWLIRLGLIKSTDQRGVVMYELSKEAKNYFQTRGEVESLYQQVRREFFYREYYWHARNVYFIVSRLLKRITTQIQDYRYEVNHFQNTSFAVRTQIQGLVEREPEMILYPELGEDESAFFRRNPRQIFDLMEAVSETKVWPTESMLLAARTAVGLLSREAAKKKLSEIFSFHRNFGIGLHLAYQIGLIQRAFPVFDHLENLYTDADSAHQRSVASHTVDVMDTIEWLQSIPRTSVYYPAYQVYQEIFAADTPENGSDVRVLRFAGLLHDAAKKSYGAAYDPSHQIKSAEELVPEELSGTGLSPEQIRRVQWLVWYHQELNGIVRQYEKNPEGFYSQVKILIQDPEFNEANLKLLYILSIADRMGVDLKDREEAEIDEMPDGRPTAQGYVKRIHEVYGKLLELARLQHDPEAARRLTDTWLAEEKRADEVFMASLKDNLRRDAESWKNYFDEAEMLRLFDLTSELYPPGTLRRQGIRNGKREMLDRMLFVNRLEKMNRLVSPSVAVRFSSALIGSQPMSHITVGVGRDALGTLYRISGVLAAFGFDIKNAEIQTASDGLVLNHFFGYSVPEKMPVRNEEKFQEHVEKFLIAVIQRGMDIDRVFRYLETHGIRISFDATGAATPTQIEFEEIAASDSKPPSTRLVLRTRNRTGLIYVVARSLTALGINVRKAPIGTYVGGVQDIFDLSVVNPLGVQSGISEAQKKIILEKVVPLLDQEKIHYTEVSKLIEELESIMLNPPAPTADSSSGAAEDGSVRPELRQGEASEKRKREFMERRAAADRFRIPLIGENRFWTNVHPNLEAQSVTWSLDPLRDEDPEWQGTSFYLFDSTQKTLPMDRRSRIQVELEIFNGQKTLKINPVILNQTHWLSDPTVRSKLMEHLAQISEAFRLQLIDLTAFEPRSELRMNEASAFVHNWNLAKQALEDERLYRFIVDLHRFNYGQFGIAEAFTEKIFSSLRNFQGSSIAEVKAFLRAQGVDYSENPYREAYQRYKKGSKHEVTFAMISDLLPQDGVMIDLGAGDGQFSNYLAEKIPGLTKVYAYETPFYKVPDAKLHPKVERITGVAEAGSSSRFRIPLSDAAVDAVYMQAVAHHLTEADQKHFWDEIARVLKPGGRLIVIEDSFPQKISDDIQVFHPSMNRELTDRYLALSMEERKKYLAFLDFYSNVIVMGHDDFSFPFGFRSIEEWQTLIESSGFQVMPNALRFTGFIAGRFHQPGFGILAFQKRVRAELRYQNTRNMADGVVKLLFPNAAGNKAQVLTPQLSQAVEQFAGDNLENFRSELRLAAMELLKEQAFGVQSQELEVDQALADFAVTWFTDLISSKKLSKNLAVGFDLQAQQSLFDALKKMDAKSKISAAFFAQAMAKDLKPESLSGLIPQFLPDLSRYQPNMNLSSDNSQALAVIHQGSEYDSSNGAVFGVGVQDDGIQDEPFLEVVEKVVQITAALLVADRLSQRKYKAADLKNPAVAQEIKAELLRELFDDQELSNGISFQHGHLTLSRSALKHFVTQHLAKLQLEQAA